MKRSIIAASLLLFGCSETPRSLFPAGPQSADMATTANPDLFGVDGGTFKPTAPNVMAVSPQKLSTAGGDQLTVTGGPFSTTTNFFINNQLANVMSVTSTTAVLLTPAHAGIGPVSIVARNPDGQSSMNSNVAKSPTALTFYASQLQFAINAYPTQAALPHGVALGDLNGDGKIDAIVTHLNSASYTIFIGNGFGSFAPLQPTAAFGYAVSGNGANNTTNLVDVNGDGKLDMIMGTNGNQIIYYLGNGTGLINQVAQVLANTSGNVFSQVAVDFNGDKQLDLVTANVNASNIGLFVNTSANNSLYSGGQYMVLNPGGQPTRVQAADINNDGKMDLVAVMLNNAGPTLAVYIGTGQQAGPFAQANPLNYGSNNANQGSQWMELGDLNNDGKVDCVVSDINTNTIRVFIGTGSANASFNAANNPVFVGVGPQQLALGDVNGDGNQDVIVANRLSNNISVLLGDGTGDFSARLDFPSVNQPYAVSVVDLNGDKKQDLVVINEANSSFGTNPGNMTVYLNISQ